MLQTEIPPTQDSNLQVSAEKIYDKMETEIDINDLLLKFENFMQSE